MYPNTRLNTKFIMHELVVQHPRNCPCYGSCATIYSCLYKDFLTTEQIVYASIDY